MLFHEASLRQDHVCRQLVDREELARIRFHDVIFGTAVHVDGNRRTVGMLRAMEPFVGVDYADPPDFNSEFSFCDGITVVFECQIAESRVSTGDMPLAGELLNAVTVDAEQDSLRTENHEFGRGQVARGAQGFKRPLRRCTSFIRTHFFQQSDELRILVRIEGCFRDCRISHVLSPIASVLGNSCNTAIIAFN